MEGLDRLQTSLFQIKHLLLTDEIIRKLLFYSEATCLSGVTPTIAEVNNRVVAAPVFNMNKEPYDKFALITVTMAQTNFDFDISSHKFNIRINCVARTETWELENNKIRTVEMFNRIIQVLHGKKLSSSHTLSYLDGDLVILNDDIQGYTILFDLIDGGGLENEF